MALTSARRPACPPGWGHDPSQSHHVAKLALDTGVWPLKEAVDGRVRHTWVPVRRRPVEDYLRAQRRFGHLFSATRQGDIIATIRASIDAYWANLAWHEGPAAERRGAAGP